MEMDFFTPPPPVQQDTSGSAFAPVAMGGGGGAPEPESFRGEEHLFDPPPVPPAAPPPPAAPMGHQPAAGQPPPERTSKFWRMAFYQQFFQVETKDVTHRIQSVFTPWKAPSYLRQQQLSYSSLGEAVQDPQSRLDAPADGLSVEPDLYGPVWVTSTLWISLAVFGHIASKLAWHGETILTPQAPDSEGDPRPALRSSGTWDYSFAWALVGAAVVYSYSIGVPLLLYFAMRCKQVPVQFFDAFCLYSYSNVTFVAAAVLCIIPVNVLQWLFVVLAGAASTANIVLNLWGAWRRHLPTEWFAGCVGTVAMLHLGLTLFLKLFCFNWSGSDPGDVK